MRRRLALAAPLLLLMAWKIAPLATGERTLFLRDVLNTHLALRATLAEGLSEGTLPLVDPLRAGGQPLAGNPNAVAFYPDNLLLLVASPLWQLNAHFWLHWLLALAAATWLGRAWGLGREGALAAGAAYAFSGLMLSQLNLYNGVAPVALAPALAAALLESGETRTRRRGLLATGLLLALALLGGDPILAGLGLLAGAALAVGRHGRALPAGRLAFALAAGVLLALPQLGEMLRILGESYRGFWGYDAAAQARTAPDPRAAIDLVLPLFFGRPDLGQVWGSAYFGGFPPLYFSLAPGWLALTLAACGVARERRAVVAALLVAIGLAAAFSGGTPWGGALAALPAGGLFRFPVKLALLAALGGSLLAGSGLERALSGERRRALGWGLAFAAVAGLALWALLSSGVATAPGALFTEGLAGAALAAERTRWAGIALISALAAGLAALGWRFLPERTRGPALLALHAATQLLLLAPLAPTDEAAFYRGRAPVADLLPAGARLAHAGVGELFGPGWGTPGEAPDRRTVWLARRAHAELHPFAGRPLGFAYELDIAPDGLDAFVTHAVARGMKHFSDERRLAVLEALGVERLLLFRELEGEAARRRARLEATTEAEGAPLHVYALPGALPRAALLGTVRYAPTMNAALEAVFASGFDARALAVVAGEGEPRLAPPGRVELLVDEAERVEAEVDSVAGGVLVLARAHLPIWRAEIDGVAAPTCIAQLTRLAVEVPPGVHRVRFSVSRRPTAAATGASFLGWIALALATRRRSGVPDAGRRAGPVLASSGRE